MRIRSIKPEFWSSEDIGALPWDVRLLFIGLWSYVADSGVGRDNEKLIVADLFPLEDDPREALATVSRGLATLSDAGLITRYRVGTKRFLHIVNWAAHQKIDKPTRSPFPPPTCEDAVFGEPSRATRESSPPGSREQGNKGTREQGIEGAGEQVFSSEIADAIPDAPRPEVERICTALADAIERNGSKRPAITKAWRVAARLMLDKDERSEAEVLGAIAWCQSDEFWRANVLSLPKLRDKYDQLRLQATRKNGAASKQAETDDLFSRAAQRLGVTQ